MDIQIASAQLNAHDTQLGDTIVLQEVRLSATGIRLRASPAASVSIAEINATIILTEASLNRFLSRQATGQISDLQIAMLTGRVRITGRYRKVRALAIPFIFTAVPEIEGGARLRLDPRQMSFVGAPLPAFVTNIVSERVNVHLAEALDITQLSLPIRLTSLAVEPGRLILNATASIEYRPEDRQMVISEQSNDIAEK